MFKQIISVFSLLFIATQLLATHNFSGEIIFQKTGGLGVTATILTYTKASSVNADRDTLTICWGDGSCDKVIRLNGSGHGEIIATDIKKNIYTGAHTYAAEGIYWISMTDPNRSGGIININPPASDVVPFHLEAMVRLLPDAAASTHSPVFQELPIGEGFVQQPYLHVPNGFDADGDSLAYALAVPLQGPGSEVPNYSWPNEIFPNQENQIFLDANTGKFTWDAPQVAGHYVIAIVVRAYRNGVLVEETRRDLLIEVSPNANMPPVLTLTPDIAETEIVEMSVGQTVQIQLAASDPDVGQSLSLTVTGGLFENFFQEKATFSSVAGTGVFTWTAKSEHVREQPHQVVFKAKDDVEDYGLAAFRVVRFHVNAVVGVVGPSADLLAMPIFPNPNAGTFSVELPTSAQPGMAFRVVGLSGQTLLEKQTETGNTQQTVQAGDLPAGLYFLQVVAEGRVLAVEKFVKE